MKDAPLERSHIQRHVWRISRDIAPRASKRMKNKKKVKVAWNWTKRSNAPDKQQTSIRTLERKKKKELFLSFEWQGSKENRVRTLRRKRDFYDSNISVQHSNAHRLENLNFILGFECYCAPFEHREDFLYLAFECQK